jgi:glycosyltransferase involved in cell wall biosynthesis
MPAQHPIALVHDWLNQFGGAEDVLTALVELFPDAPLYTSIYWPEAMPAAWAKWDIRPLWLNKIPGIHQHHQRYLPLYPLAFAGLSLANYRLVISNKSGFCHGIRKGKNTTHVCYCLAPTRYVWQYDAYMAREEVGGTLRKLIAPVIGLLRRWDYAAAQRVDHFIAISSEIQARIKQYYQRDSVVIYPPVDVERFVPASPSQIGDYYLVVSRLIPYKRIDLAVRACSQLGLPLYVAGRGRDLDKLQAIAGPSVKFLGFVSDSDLPMLMAQCKAFIFPGLEDFGITPVQAQAAGRPVIAFRGGGTLDTVQDGQTGLFFDTPSTESLMEALQRFEQLPANHFDPGQLRANALRFDKAVFAAALRGFLAGL